MEPGRIIEQQMLENGIELILYDRSRVMAGDRWLVELKCEAYIQIDEGFWDMVEGEDSGLQPELRSMLGDRLIFETSKQRNFIDAGERDAVLREMVRQVRSSVLEYLKRPHFPEEFFKKQYREALQKLMLRQAMDRQGSDC